VGRKGFASRTSGFATTSRQDGPERVVAYVRGLVECGALGPGGRLPAERELVQAVGLGRLTVRDGLHALRAMGVVETRHGSGSYIAAGPPRLASQPLNFLEALHRVSCDEMYEARRILEVDVAGLAAERATAAELATLGKEVASHFTLTQDPAAFLTHDIAFHRLLSAASRNPILATLVEMVSEAYYARRRESAPRAPESARRRAADMHRRIYTAVRSRNVARARQAMDDHIVQARRAQSLEVVADVAEGEPIYEATSSSTWRVRAAVSSLRRKATPNPTAGTT